jgi:predicted ATP-binding protein involved in virulence
LQNPELVFRRKRGILKRQVKPLLKKLFHLGNDDDVYLTSEGITIDGPWGRKMPLRDLADGYKSTFQWVIDFIGWAILHQPTAARKLETEGIVLVDSIEEHLHPKWQRTIVRDLRLAFPRIQFITTSHSPMIAGNTRIDSILNSESRLHHLFLTKEGVRSSEIKEDLTELNCDQILASEAFGHIPYVNEELPELLTKASALASRDDRTEEEEDKLNKIKDILKSKMFPEGRTLIERIVERDYYKELESEIKSIKQLIERDSNDND